MARIQYGPSIADIAGSIGGVSFQRNTSGAIARSRISPAISRTNNLLNGPISVFNLTQSWRFLSPSDIDSWNAFAAAHTRENKFGKTVQLSGFQWYISVNTNSFLIGGTGIPTAPTYTLPAGLVSAYIAVEFSSPNFYLKLYFDPDPVATGDTYIIYATPFTLKTGTSFQSLLRQTAIIPGGTSSPYDITDIYQSIFGLKLLYPGYAIGNIGCLAYPIHNSTGLTGPAVRSSTPFEAT